MFLHSIQHFDSIKWKKRLTKLVKRSPKECGRNATSATVMAAATEKYIRSKPPTEIATEDLTASQFAHITGMNTRRSEPSLTSDDESDDDLLLTASTTYTPPQSMQIWDSHFWKETGTTCLTRELSEGVKVPSMIQKGRFKIVWGRDDNEPIVAPAPHVVEWKRKRACST